jgi:hypothetical protein
MLGHLLDISVGSLRSYIVKENDNRRWSLEVCSSSSTEANSSIIPYEMSPRP